MAGGSFRGRMVALTLFAVFAALVWLATWPPGFPLDLFEQGHWLGPASDMLRGKVPYRDTLPVHGLLADGGLDYLLFRLFGPSFRNSMTARQLLGGLFQPAIYLVAAAATRRPFLALLSIPASLGFASGLVFDRAVLPLLALAAFLAAIDESEDPGRVRAALAGALSGLGILYALDFGTFVLAAEIAVLLLAAVVRGPRIIRGAAFAAGLAAVLVPFLAFLASRGALAAFLRTSFVDLPLWIGPAWGLKAPPWKSFLGALLLDRRLLLPGVGEMGRAVAWRIVLAPVLGVAAVLGALFLYRRGGGRPLAFRVFAVGAACAFFSRYVYGRFHHEGGNALAGAALLLVVVSALRPPGSRRADALQEPRARPRVGLGVGGAVLAALAAMSVVLADGPARTAALAAGAAQRILDGGPGPRPDCVTLGGRGGGARIPSADARRLAAWMAFFRGNVGAGPILDLSNQPALYFFLERRNPTRFYQVPLMERSQDEVLRSLDADPPAAVILSGGTWMDTPDGRPNRERAARVFRRVEERFPRRAAVGGGVVALPPLP